jgi:hypothetical protein
LLYLIRFRLVAPRLEVDNLRHIGFDKYEMVAPDALRIEP